MEGELDGLGKSTIIFHILNMQVAFIPFYYVG